MVLGTTACDVISTEDRGHTTTPQIVGSDSASPTPTSSSSSPSSEASPSPSPGASVAAMSLDQQAAQLFVVGALLGKRVTPTVQLVRDRQIGGVFLAGRSTAGVEAVANLNAQFTAANTSKLPLIVATDQEGGQVQVLQGDGFSDIPAATFQGRWSAPGLRRESQTWASELADAGVNLNLAPVVDLVPTAVGTANGPVGRFSRQYGSAPDPIVAHAAAFADGMEAAGVEPVFKHFPGLGHVQLNTDTSAGVVDTTVAADSPDVDIYRQLIADGASTVMVSSAVYAKIDPRRAAVFSPAVITRLLREDLGFDGVVISDDLSAARQVQAIDPGQRAVRAIRAGVDLVLVSAAPQLASQMIDAVVAEAQRDPQFAARVTEAARQVVTWKTAHLE